MKIAKGRRLKRYLGLIRESTPRIIGGIEVVTPGMITGWLFGKGSNFHEVRLLIDKELICSSRLDIKRPDVNRAHSLKGNHGFKLSLPSQISNLEFKSPPRLLAMNVDGSIQIDLKLLKEPELTDLTLTKVIKSGILGIQGQLDGIVEDGLIHGWAGYKENNKIVEVWLQCSGFDPIKLVCNKHRENMEIAGLKANSGFSIHPNDLPISWQGKNIECSFDYGGKYLLNQKGTVLVPLIKNEIITNRSTIVKENLNDLSYISKIKTAPSDLQNYWYQLEDFRLFLDELDYKIKKFDEIRQHDNLKGKENFFKRLLSNIKKKT